MLRRASKRQRGLPPGHSNAIDWYGGVFASNDLLPLLLDALVLVEDFMALSLTCVRLRDETADMRRFVRTVLNPPSFESSEKASAIAMCACMTGDVRVVQFAHERVGKLDMEGAMGAAGMGYIHILGYLMTLGYTMDSTVACMAAQHDQLAPLHFLQLYDYPILTSAVKFAVANGATGCLKAFLNKDIAFANNETGYASREFVDLSQKPRLQETLVSLAAEKGHIDVLSMLCEWGCPVTAGNAEMAAAHGQLEVLKFMWGRLPQWGWGFPVIAATMRNSKLEAFKYCYDTFGHALDAESLVSYAVQSPNVPACLEYILKQGCPYEVWHANYALMKGDWPGLMRAFAAAGHVWTNDDLTSAVILGNLRSAEVLHCEMKIEWQNSALGRLITKGEIDRFMWAFEHGAGISENDLDHACISDRVRMLEILLKEGRCVPTEDTLILCVRNKRIECAQTVCAHMGREWTAQMEREIRVYLRLRPKPGGNAFLKKVFG